MLDTDDPSVLGGVRQGLVSKNKLDQEEASDALRDRMTLIARGRAQGMPHDLNTN